jgi:hypothetical protein
MKEWKIGDRVTFTTTGRYPRGVTGEIVQIEKQTGAGRGQTGTWVHVRSEDRGPARKTRPGTLTAA